MLLDWLRAGHNYTRMETILAQAALATALLTATALLVVVTRRRVAPASTDKEEELLEVGANLRQQLETQVS